jgi:hypothetical protein
MLLSEWSSSCSSALWYVTWVISLDLLLSQLQWSALWVHLSWPSVQYTHTQNFWHNSTRKHREGSNSMIAEAECPGQGRGWEVMSHYLPSEITELDSPIVFIMESRLRYRLWVFWASGRPKNWTTAVIDSPNSRSAGCLSWHKRNACENLMTETFWVTFRFNKLLLFMCNVSEM